MIRTLTLAALAALTPSVPSGHPIDARHGGRVVEARGGARFGWPGAWFEGRFEGRAVHAAVATESDFFRLLVDGVERARLDPGHQQVTIDGLADGAHVVRLELLTENQAGSSRFLGFDTPGKPLPPPRPRAHRIEIIGDSHSVGYGDTSPKRDCTRPEVHDTTDTQQAYGPLLAKRLGWDYRVHAYSGFGIVRNYNGGVPGDSMVKRYPRAIPGEPAAAADDGWRPDWVVINLGTNDFSTALHPGEAWADAAALHADYRATYARFLRGLEAKYPKARFVLMAADAFLPDVQAVAAAVKGPVTLVHTPAMELTACDWHPSLKDQQAMADAVAKVIAPAVP